MVNGTAAFENDRKFRRNRRYVFDFGNFNHQIQNEPVDSDSLRLYAAFILRQVARLYLGAGYRWNC